MILGGLQKTSLIDYPGKVGCTVFVVGCNFRCPFCHNKDLVTLELFKKAGIKPIKEEDFFAFLEKRKRLLDGVIITGGEPTICQDLPQFCQKIKDLGFKVKLDTNGSHPVMLKKLIKNKRIDFIAMDIKTAFDEYQKAIGLSFPIDKIKESIRLILKSNLPYEFRTTTVPRIHNKEIMIKLAKQLKREANKVEKEKKVNWVLQQFRPKNCLDKKFLKVKPYRQQEMKKILRAVKEILPNVKLRGND